MNKILHKKIIVSGAEGQLGQSFYKIHRNHKSFDFIFLNKKKLDILNPAEIKSVIDLYKPAVWINCAAYTKVDLAEDESALAFAINAAAVKNIAVCCSTNSVQLIHFSSDYVYDNEKQIPLEETDECAPKSEYAKSKLAGEKFILAQNDSHVIIRTSWLYATTGHNFVKTIIRLSQIRDEIRIVNDQIGAPTYAGDLANAVLTILSRIEENPELKESWKGVFNYANSGVTNWYEFAQEILDTAGTSRCQISPISSKEFNAKAHRPDWSVLSTERIRQTFGIEIPDWKTSLHKCIHEMIN